MKDLSSRWVALTLLAPVLVLLGLLMMSGGPPQAASVPPHKGTVEVAFTTDQVTQGGLAAGLSFQRVLLNVISVRLNPSTDRNVSDADSKWQNIDVPAGVGKNSGVGTVATGGNFGGNFGPNGTVVSVGQGRSEIQLDMLTLQNNSQIFNSGLIKGQTYHVVELVLDPANPGNVVPLCGQSSPRGEGCIVYPVTLTSGNSNIRAPLVSLDISNKQTQLLMVKIDVSVGSGPVTSGDSVQITPVIDVVPNSTSSSSIINPSIATVTGIIPNPGSKEVVTAELTGTNQIVATASVQTTNGQGSYTMYLPPDNYDFYATGGAVGIVARSNINVPLGSTPTEVDFPKPGSHSSTTISGHVNDTCTGLGIPGAIVELFMPDSNTTTDCSDPLDANGAVIPGCVIVASATTDEAGKYPLPGSSAQRAPFTMVPSLPSGVSYTLLATASGYNGLLTTPMQKGTFRCPSLGAKKNACDFSLERGEIEATVDLGAVNNSGSPINVLVMAEDHGTNKIEGVALATVQTGVSTSRQVSVFVPDNSAMSPATNPVASYDLFAAAQDTFAGQASKNNVGPQAASGHTIAVTAGPGGAGVPGSAKCPPSGTGPPATLSGVSCVGFGSIAGTLTRIADDNTQVILSKADGTAQVQVMTSQVAPMGASNSSIFNFCAPADPNPYTITDEENPPNSTPSVIGTFTTTLATPTTMPTPCAGICAQTAPPPTQCILCSATKPNVSLP